MAIEVLTLSKGIQVPDIVHWLDLVNRVEQRRQDQFVQLEPGVYDLTPDVGYTYGGKEELTVFDNGEGRHRAIIQSDKVHAELINPELPDALSMEMPSGCIFQLPADKTRLTIFGQKKNSPEVMRLFSIIRWKA